MAEKGTNEILEDIDQGKSSVKKWLTGLLILIILAGILAIVLSPTLLTYIQPNEFGIKEVRIGVHRGIQKTVYKSGFHILIPTFEKMHRFPRDIQVLELTNRKQTASRFVRQDNSAHIQTSDGFFVDVDVSILYRIKDPYLVFTTIGPGKLYEDNGIIPRAEPILKETLGELTTEEFYNSLLRVEKTVKAQKQLNEELNPKGIQVDQVLVRYFQYSQEIQRNIEEKKLKDQLAEKYKAEAKAAREAALIKKVIEEGKASVRVMLEEGKAYKTRKMAERDLYVRSQRAQANLLVKLAEARRTELKNVALQGAGSDRLVGLRMAEVIRGIETLILPSDGPQGINPLNLGQTLRLLEVRQPEKEEAK
ncbi:MAG: SPFH domain-containing protein [Deltaproteobacteria bacterium]|nr:SPFH domain-containing protein [Deltaproteobacteria bacterium]MBW2307516.1 SPFH domain-containing protein [Deltaproteobacteria bacterium]